MSAARNSATTRTYAALDPHPLPGLSYNRLCQVDLDGTATFSPTVPVALSTERQPHLYLNPTRGLLTLDLSPLPAAPCALRLLDVLGCPVLETTLPGSQSAALDLGPLPAGTYLLLLQALGQAPIRQRVVKE